MIFLLQLLLYEYYCKITFEYEKEIPQEEITWISLELVMAKGNFLSEFMSSLNSFQSYLQPIQSNDKTSAMSGSI